VAVRGSGIASGRWLRRWRLDEFPQFVNVLKGDMSIVGPRPMSPKHADTLTESQRAELHTVRPGLTSPASIAFLAEDAVLANHPDAETLYLEKILPAKVEWELEYVREPRSSGDLRVILQTLGSLWSRTQRDCSSNMIQRLLDG
jgi:lipopolysaccharide/colanic/teichoic acid biosynthesis glycosyltransferase